MVAFRRNKQSDLYIMDLKKIGIFIFDTLKLAIVAVVIVLPIRYFVIQPFFVLGASMEPTFHNGDYLIIDEISYRLGEPERGNIIVFRYPNNPKQFYIKRIVGLPGEVVVINEQGVTIKNKENPDGLLLKEEYLREAHTYGNMSQTLTHDEYFVLGDNREASSDSRRWGALKEEFIVGKVFVRAYPFQNAEVFK